MNNTNRNKRNVKNASELYQKYVDVLSSVPGVAVKQGRDENSEYKEFTSKKVNSLKVTLYKHNFSGDFVALSIENVDTEYWHTADENEDLDFYIDLALSALNGDVRRSLSKVMKFEEMCFKVDETWYCTRIAGSHAYHYISKKKTL